MCKPLLVALVLVQTASASPARSTSTSSRARRSPRAAPAVIAWEARPADIAICRRPRPIRRTVKQHLAQLRQCYARETQFRGGPDGTVMLHFTVEADGRVTHASAESELPAVTSCVLAELRSWTFPVDDDAVHVNYPLRFQLDRSGR